MLTDSKGTAPLLTVVTVSVSSASSLGWPTSTLSAQPACTPASWAAASLELVCLFFFYLVVLSGFVSWPWSSTKARRAGRSLGGSEGLERGHLTSSIKSLYMHIDLFSDDREKEEYRPFLPRLLSSVLILFDEHVISTPVASQNEKLSFNPI